MSDLFGNHIVGFPTRRLNYAYHYFGLYVVLEINLGVLFIHTAASPVTVNFFSIILRCNLLPYSYMHWYHTAFNILVQHD